MNNLTAPTMQNEISNLATVVTDNLSVLEGLSQGNLDTLTASSATLQTITGGISTKLVDLKAVFTAATEAQSNTFTTISETQTAAITTASEAQNAATITASETLSTAATAMKDELIKSGSEKNNELITAMGGIQEKSDSAVADKFKEINDALQFSTDYINSVVEMQNKIKGTLDQTKGSTDAIMGEQKNLPGLLDEKIQGPIQAQTESEKIETGKTRTISSGIQQNTIDMSFADKRSLALAEEGNALSKRGNLLAMEGNFISAIGNAIAAISSDSIIQVALATISAGIVGVDTIFDLSKKLSKNGNTAISTSYASGGFPSMGQMFIAREAGPELVGTIGSRSAVVNNDQIVESVSAGVYRAVKAAMGQNGGGVIQLILDGTKVAEVVSDNVNAITRRTGRCPILV